MRHDSTALHLFYILNTHWDHGKNCFRPSMLHLNSCYYLDYRQYRIRISCSSVWLVLWYIFNIVNKSLEQQNQHGISPSLIISLSLKPIGSYLIHKFLKTGKKYIVSLWKTLKKLGNVIFNKCDKCVILQAVYYTSLETCQ